MAKECKTAVVPRLRFPEFDDSWQLKPLAPYLEECGSKVDATTSLPIYSSSRSGLTPQASYYDGRTLINDGEYGVVPPNCFVYRHMSDDGRFAFNVNETGSEIAVSKEYPVFRTVDLDPKFLLAKLNHSSDFKVFALSQKAGGTRTRLYFSKLRAWETLLPSLAEQQKIAECLTSLDELIAAQGRKVEALKTYKRGLMQQLFPREGETLPRLRFPEFRNAPAWEEDLLSKVSPGIYDGTHQTPAYTSEGVPFYSVENLVSGNANKFISRADYLVATRKNKPEKGDILLTRIGKIGYSAVVTWEKEFSVYVTLAVIQRSPRFSSHFMHYFIQSARYQSELRSKSLPNAVPPKINLDNLRSTKVLLPKEGEQQRIADFLSSLDAQIVAEADKLDSLRKHKQGLMQQLFPSLTEN